MRDMRCEGCGDRFRCRADDDQACWCVGVELPAEARTELAATAADCVCPACLADAARSADAVGASADRDR